MNGILIFAVVTALTALYVYAEVRSMNRREAEEERRRAAEQAAKERAEAMVKAQKQRKAAARAAEKASRLAEQQQRRADRERAAQEAHAKKVARAAELAELAERRLCAEKELAELRRAESHATDPAEAPETPAPVEAVEPASAASPVEQEEAPAQWRSYFKGNNMFAGECVAFTGTLSGMTRREAISAVEANGGRAFDRMPACTTMLVVADKGAGNGKLDLADQRIGQVKKITERAFKSMLTMQLTVTPEELAAAFAAQLAVAPLHECRRDQPA